MKGNALHVTAERRDTGAAAIAIDRTEPVQQAKRGVNAIGRGRFKPIERQRIGAPRQEVQDGRRKIDSRNVRFTMRAQPVAGIPQPPDEAGTQSRRTARPLICRIQGDPLEREAVDPAIGVIARHLYLTRVDDGGHARHRQRCFSDVRRQDDTAPIDGANRRILRIAVQRPVEWNDLTPVGGRD